MANIFTQNPMRVDTAMVSDYLTTIAASAGLERPVKVVKLRFENATGQVVTEGAITVTDGAGTPNTIYEFTFPTTTATTAADFQSDFVGTLLWRNFKVTAIPANVVMWIYRR